MCRIDLCGQIGVKISSYGDTQFIKINPLNCPMGQFIRREDISGTEGRREVHFYLSHIYITPTYINFAELCSFYHVENVM